MGTLGRIALAVLAISFVTFLALFGRLPALRKTPIGFLSRLLCERIPHTLWRIDRTITGGSTTKALTGLGNYLFYKKNPVVLILFLVILTGSASLFLTATYSQLRPDQFFPLVLLLPAPYLFTYLCANNRKIYITSNNHDARMYDYPYDHILYRPHVVCTTCHLTKPARSKHCSLCGVCVSRSDHHCPWINNCLGRDNYRWFLALLLSLGVLEIYGAVLCYTILSPHLYMPPSTDLSWTSKVYWHRVANVAIDATNRGGLSIAGVGLLAITTAPLPLTLLAYHVYLVWAGMTTNESSKWTNWGEDMADGIVFRAKRSDVLAHNQLMREQLVAHQSQGGRLERKLSSLEQEAEEPKVDWPVSSDQIILATNNGKPPVGREYLYERIWSLSAVDNIYDLGFWDNLVCVLQGR